MLNNCQSCGMQLSNLVLTHPEGYLQRLQEELWFRTSSSAAKHVQNMCNLQTKLQKIAKTQHFYTTTSYYPKRKKEKKRKRKRKRKRGSAHMKCSTVRTFVYNLDWASGRSIHGFSNHECQMESRKVGPQAACLRNCIVSVTSRLWTLSVRRAISRLRVVLCDWVLATVLITDNTIQNSPVPVGASINSRHSSKKLVCFAFLKAVGCRFWKLDNKEGEVNKTTNMLGTSNSSVRYELHSRVFD